MNRNIVFTIFLLSIFQFKTQAQINRPKLVVGLVIDQMRWDYLYRYNDLYSAGGFKRLLRDGFSCENTMIPYIPTVTAAGHTCIYTGSTPAIHGIVANDWVDKATGIKMYCSKDTTVSSIGTTNKKDGQMSPRNMQTNTIGDELKLAFNFRNKVIGIALKDRGAILPAGHSANAAYWFDDSTGVWMTSTYYNSTQTQLPNWVQQYNQRRVPDSLMKNDWNLLLDKSKYVQSTEDNMWFEKKIDSDSSRTFPHHYQTVIGSKNYNSFRVSPFGNTYTLDFAKETIKNEKLGQTPFTDMLCVSISSTDYLGHRFGPNSLEIEDTYLRLDREIANFLTYLDNTIGKNNYTIFLTADHGAPQIAQFLKSKKYATAGTLDANKLVKDINQLCKSKFGLDSTVIKVYDYQMYLNHKYIDGSGVNKIEVKNFIVQYLKTLPEVWNAYDAENLNSTILPSVVKEKIANSYYYRRSGDIQYFYKPQYTDYTIDGLEHGAWYPYDAHIPLVWFGWGIKQGKTNRETLMTDIAATLAGLLQIQMPNGCIGKVISEVIK